MKKIVKSLILIAAAAMGFTACQEELQNDAPLTEETVEVKFVASSADTKTSVDTSGDTPLFAWGENETFTVLEQTTDALSEALSEATNVVYAKDQEGKANITATFDANAGKESYNYVTVYPASGYVSAESLAAATLSLPAVQTMAEGSYDPAADLMVSEVVTTTAQPAEAQMVRFTRLAAVAKMKLKGLALAEGDQVEQVIFTADGKNLAGTVTADLADPHKFTVAEGVNNVTVNTTSSTDVYFTVLPTTLEAGDAYTVAVITKEKLYIKTGTIPAENSLVFEAGMVTRFGVNMEGVEPIDKWILVKDASTLKEGDVVAIVAKDYDKALSTKLYNDASETSTSAKRDAEDISKFMDYIIANTYVQQLVLVTGTVDGTFSFYDEARQKFLVSSTTSNAYLINQAYCNENTSFKVTIDENTIATITNISGTYSGNYLRYNTSDYFVSNTSKYAKDVCIYLLAGVTRSIPTVPANITVPEEDESVVISEDKATEPTAISTELVKFNYVGPWTITPSVTYTDAADDWLNVTYDAENNCLTYTAEANAGAKRNATVTLTATLGEQTLEPWTFNVIQKGAAQEISIAEFVKLAKDENQPYKLTGKVVTLATNATSSGYFLEDGEGNQAQITYLDTEDGENVWGHDDLKLEIGDIVTVTTYAQGSKKGGSYSLPSIYKGHYRLSATAGIAADYTGGDVVITVETSSNGTVTAPETIEATRVEYDYATFSYSGGNTATVTFTSENATSYAREVEVTFTCGDASVTVVAQQGINPANKLGYELVTDASTLAVGDEVIIVAKNADKAIAVPTSTSATSFPVAAISKTGNVIYDIEDAGVQVFTLSQGVSEGTMAFDFIYKGKGYRLYMSSGLKLRETSYAVNAATSWTISINPGDGDATITSTRLIKYNSATGTAFTAYATSNSNATKAENAVCIYKKQTK